MDRAAWNTETLSLYEPVPGWSKLYDLAAGVLRAQLRPTAASPLLLYEWATANDTLGTAQGRIDLLPLKANGRIAFYANPAPGDVVSFGSRAVTFVTGTPSAFQVQIRPTRTATISALRDLLAASSDPDLAQCTYGLTGSTVLVEFKTAGLAGNVFEIGATGDDVVLSGLTLSDGGFGIGLSAPLIDVQALRGSYALDVRYEHGPIAAVLLTYSLTFRQGVTR